MPNVSRPARYAVRSGLVRLGGGISGATLERVRSAHSYLELGAWLSQVSDGPTRRYPSRFDLFEVALTRVRGSAPLYLEFGVFEGESLRWWSQHLAAPGAVLVGFDSFGGLPESWKLHRPAGHFATGQIPRIDDPRVSFEVGLFQDTLPGFEPPPHDFLVLNIDSDLYSSAALVLEHLGHHLGPGVLIYFDELNDRDHELRAFPEFLDRTGKRVRVLGSAKGGVSWLFEFV